MGGEEEVYISPLWVHWDGVWNCMTAERGGRLYDNSEDNGGTLEGC